MEPAPLILLCAPHIDFARQFRPAGRVTIQHTTLLRDQRHLHETPMASAIDERQCSSRRESRSLTSRRRFFKQFFWVSGLCAGLMMAI